VSIYNKVRAVEKVFRSLEKEMASFQQGTGMHCLLNCGKCCTKPDISATPLEFLPLAYHLFKSGKALAFYEQLKTESSPVCMLLSPVMNNKASGFCSQYQYRGLICRLFGFSAILDKYGNKQLITCKPIKEELPDAYRRGLDRTEKGQVVLMRDYYYQLTAIDTNLGREQMPINQAIRKALEAVMAYYSYRRIRKTG